MAGLVLLLGAFAFTLFWTTKFVVEIYKASIENQGGPVKTTATMLLYNTTGEFHEYRDEFLLTGVLTYGSYLVLNEVDEKLRILDNIKREWDNFFSPGDSSSSGNSTDVVPPDGSLPDSGPAPPSNQAGPPPPPPPTIPSASGGSSTSESPITPKRVLRKRKKEKKKGGKQPRQKIKESQHMGISQRERPVSDDYDVPKRYVRFKIEDDSIENMETGLKRRRAVYESKISKQKRSRAKNNNWDSKRTKIVRYNRNNKQMKVRTANEFIEFKKLTKRNNFKKPVRKVKRKEFGTSKSTQLERKRNQKAGLRRKNKNNKRVRPKKVEGEYEYD